MSRLFLRTLRDDPSDAEVDSHRLLTRAGCIRRVAAGMYSWMPLGYRVLRKVEQIVREEMDAAGAQELLLPIVQPLELWERSGRDVAYGPLMFRMEDRKETGFCLAPTAEEVITATVAAELTSYRDLPVNLYQIHWKYRDELRPRFGLLRSREFLMKDSYSFDTDLDGLRVTYQAMYAAYHRIFERCGLTFRPVEAQAGEIGGDVNHEFMAVAAVGEDDFVWCTSCDYAANVEAARRGHAWHHSEVPAAEGSGPASEVSADASGDHATEVPAAASGDHATAVPAADVSSDPVAAVPGDAPPVEKVHTPDLPGIAGVAELLGADPADLLKCIVFDADGEIGLALVPGDREVNTYALGQALPGRSVRLYDDEDFERRPDIPKGYIGPHFAGAAIVVADPSVRRPGGWVTGANEVDHHVRNAVLGRDFEVQAWADLVTIATGDACPRCGEPLSVDRGIEVGHVFQLGTKYTEALDARYTDENGESHPMVMGCYGIGVSRVVAAVVEEHHDDAGIAWPAALTPYDVHLIVLPGRGDVAAEVVATAETLYDKMCAAGLEVLYDDRDQSPGVKFADADLLGMPVQLVIGAKGLKRGVVERKVRATGERSEPALTDDLLTASPAELRAAVVGGDA